MTAGCFDQIDRHGHYRRMRPVAMTMMGWHIIAVDRVEAEFGVNKVLQFFTRGGTPGIRVTAV